MKLTAKRVWPLTANEEIMRGVKEIEMKEEIKIGDGISSNFLKVFTIHDTNKSARRLYPSLLDDLDAKGDLANAMKILEE